MPTGEHSGDMDPDLDPLAAPTAPLPLNEPTLPFAHDGQTKVIARDGHTVRIDAPVKPADKPSDEEKSPGEPSTPKFKAEHLAASPDNIKETGN